METGTHAGRSGRSESPCPGCGSPNVLPGRVYCRPTCKARAQWREGQRAPRLPGLDPLRVELPPDPHPPHAGREDAPCLMLP
jgi:hypothetical protein